MRATRNTIFHFQRTYIGKRLDEFMSQPNSVKWVQTLHAEFDRWFLNWLQTRKTTLPG